MNVVMTATDESDGVSAVMAVSPQPETVHLRITVRGLEVDQAYQLVFVPTPGRPVVVTHRTSNNAGDRGYGSGAAHRRRAPRHRPPRRQHPSLRAVRPEPAGFPHDEVTQPCVGSWRRSRLSSTRSWIRVNRFPAEYVVAPAIGKGRSLYERRPDHARRASSGPGPRARRSRRERSELRHQARGGRRARDLRGLRGARHQRRRERARCCATAAGGADSDEWSLPDASLVEPPGIEFTMSAWPTTEALPPRHHRPSRPAAPLSPNSSTATASPSPAAPPSAVRQHHPR